MGHPASHRASEWPFRGANGARRKSPVHVSLPLKSGPCLLRYLAEHVALPGLATRCQRVRAISLKLCPVGVFMLVMGEDEQCCSHLRRLMPRLARSYSRSTLSQAHDAAKSLEIQ